MVRKMKFMLFIQPVSSNDDIALGFFSIIVERKEKKKRHEYKSYCILIIESLSF